VGGLKQHLWELRHPFPYPPRLFSLPPVMLPNVILVPVKVNNGQSPPLIVYRPLKGDRCGNSPIPCSPYIEVESAIVQRVPGKIECGFRTTGENTSDLHK